MASAPKTDSPSARLPSAAPLHPRESERLASVCGLAQCDRGADPVLDDIARQAADFCAAPFGLVSLVREEDQLFLGNCGLEGSGTPRDEAICAHTILEDGPFVVEDLREDERFAQLEIATRPPYVRFYAGAPIFDSTGLPVGSLCVLDTKPRELDSRRLFALPRFATMVSTILEARRLAVHLLEAKPHPGATDAALTRLDRVLTPLLQSTIPDRVSHF